MGSFQMRRAFKYVVQGTSVERQQVDSVTYPGYPMRIFKVLKGQKIRAGKSTFSPLFTGQADCTLKV